jgi:hypothetical protein
MLRTVRLPFVAVLLAAAAPQQAPYDLPPIGYRDARPADPVSELRVRVESGRASLAYDDEHGYLKAFLAELSVPISSQTLVFSKTSFQRHRINPRHPRAIYFNDDVYVGWVQSGEVVEISAVDPQLGAVFYTLSQERTDRVRLLRQTDNCLQCHDSQGLTLGVPGHILRSVYPSGDGTPHFNRGTFRTTDASPFSERWGGWYVTGEHASMRHLGNLRFPDDPAADTERFRERGANVTDLAGLVDTAPYLAPTSDIVALMVLQHQAHVHNLITRANHETRIAMVQCREINRLTGDPPGTLTPGTRSRILSNCEPLVRALFFSEEAPLAGPVQGSAPFAADFEKRGPFDSKGRSLRQFDLRTRLFRHPLSFLVHSKAFAGLPAEARDVVSGRMRDVLLGRETGKAYAHLSDADRAAILGILRETLPGLAGGWK